MQGNSKNKVRMVVLAIFAIGFASGLLTMNLYERFSSKDKPKPEPRQPPQVWVLDRISERVSMSPEQKEQIKAILTEQFEQFDKIRNEMSPLMKPFEPRFAEARHQSREKIRAVLTEEQRPQFDKLLEEEDKKREDRRQDEERRQEERRQKEEQRKQEQNQK